LIPWFQEKFRRVFKRAQVCKWCFVPDGDLVAGDVMLAQKVALETNERGALSVAHRSFVSMGSRRV
jgi:hypothetical protein